MLKSMFREIQRKLGNEYGLFREFNPQITRSKEILKKYKNVGVLYINNGSLNMLPDGAKMEVSYTLELFMQIPCTACSSDVVTAPLEKFALETTGVIKTDDGTSYRYVMDVGLPTCDGNITAGADGSNYVRVQMPISANITQGMYISDGGEFYITYNGCKTKLNGVISSTESPNVTLETSLLINQSVNKSIVLGKNWGLQIVANYMPDDPLHKYLKKAVKEFPEIPLQFEYSLDGTGVTEEKYVVFHDCVFTSERGQFTVMVLNVAEALTDSEIK